MAAIDLIMVVVVGFALTSIYYGMKKVPPKAVRRTPLAEQENVRVTTKEAAGCRIKKQWDKSREERMVHLEAPVTGKIIPKCYRRGDLAVDPFDVMDGNLHIQESVAVPAEGEYDSMEEAEAIMDRVLKPAQDKKFKEAQVQFHGAVERFNGELRPAKDTIRGSPGSLPADRAEEAADRDELPPEPNGGSALMDISEKVNGGDVVPNSVCGGFVEVRGKHHYFCVEGSKKRRLRVEEVDLLRAAGVAFKEAG